MKKTGFRAEMDRGAMVVSAYHLNLQEENPDSQPFASFRGANVAIRADVQQMP